MDTYPSECTIRCRTIPVVRTSNSVSSWSVVFALFSFVAVDTAIEASLVESIGDVGVLALHSGFVVFVASTVHFSSDPVALFLVLAEDMSHIRLQISGIVMIGAEL